MLGIFFSTALLSAQTYESFDLEDNLYQSVYAALSTTSDMQDVFEYEDTREKVVDTYYNTYCRALSLYKNQKELAKVYAPFLIMVDTDGYYIAYPNGDDMFVTSKYYYSKSFGDYNVTFKLNETVLVTDKSGNLYKGSYSDVYEETGRANALSFLSSKSSFYEKRRDIICEIIEYEVNYFINTHDTYSNRLQKEYIFTMPKEYEDVYSKYMENASVIAFAQGYQKSTTKGDVNIYSLCASTLDANVVYAESYIDGYLYYHELDCDLVSQDSSRKSMSKCVVDDALPCPECIH